jgi:transcriptional regulator with XRE-family HTH domain
MHDRGLSRAQAGEPDADLLTLNQVDADRNAEVSQMPRETGELDELTGLRIAPKIIDRSGLPRHGRRSRLCHGSRTSNCAIQDPPSRCKCAWRVSSFGTSSLYASPLGFDSKDVYIPRIVRAVTVSEPWSSPALRTAWVRSDWSVVFREYRRLKGLSQFKFGELIGMPQPHVSAIESGNRKIVSIDVILRISEGLGVPPELGGTPPREHLNEWHPGPELRDRIAQAHTTGKPDRRTAEWIRLVLTQQRRAEDAIGGADLWPVVRAQLDAVTSLLANSSGALADELLVLAGEHAHWLSWVAAEQSQHGAARAWLELAQGWATDAGQTDLMAWITRVRSYYHLHNGDAQRALRTAETARDMARSLTPASASIATHAASMAAAALGDRDHARRLADSAYALALQSPDEGDRPDWLYWLDPVRARLHQADLLYAIRDWRGAADAFREAITKLDEYPRDQEYYEIRLQDALQRV